MVVEVVEAVVVVEAMEEEEEVMADARACDNNPPSDRSLPGTALLREHRALETC